MPRLFIGNFSFEQSWDAGLNPTRQVIRLEAELACLWLAVACEGDEILCPVPIGEEFWARMREWGCAGIRLLTPETLKSTRADQIVPWGWTPRIREWAQRLRIPVSGPDQETIWRGNSREFAFLQCEKRGVLLPGESLIRSPEEMMQKIQRIVQSKAGWIAKPNQGQAGRGQVRGTELPEGKTLATLLRMLERQGVLHLEPVLDRLAELGLQWEIPESGEPKYLGMTTLYTDSAGRYLGSAVNGLVLPPGARDNLMKAQKSVLLPLQSMGYAGPVGMDAMLYRDQNQVCIRPIQDVNARWTMGRIALEWGNFRRRVSRSAGARGLWWHGFDSPAPGAVLLSPESLDGTPVKNRTWWLDEPCGPDTASIPPDMEILVDGIP